MLISLVRRSGLSLLAYSIFCTFFISPKFASTESLHIASACSHLPALARALLLRYPLRGTDSSARAAFARGRSLAGRAIYFGRNEARNDSGFPSSLNSKDRVSAHHCTSWRLPLGGQSAAERFFSEARRHGEFLYGAWPLRTC